jgi:hypothetical protein
MANAKPQMRKETTSTVDIDERIRQRAFELFQLRGCQDGHDFDDWMRSGGSGQAAEAGQLEGRQVTHRADQGQRKKGENRCVAGRRDVPASSANLPLTFSLESRNPALGSHTWLNASPAA